MPRPFQNCAVSLLACLGLAIGCGRPTLDVPELVSLRTALPILEAQAERDDGPPDWVHEQREDDSLVFGVGVAPATPRSQEGLYRALREARTAVLNHLHHERGAWVESPGRLGDPLQLDPMAVEYEAIHYDEDARIWYALARLDREAAGEPLAELVTRLDDAALDDARLIRNPESEVGDLVPAALRLVYALDRRAQLEAQLEALDGDVPAWPGDDDPTTLARQARLVLSEHPFRIEVDSPAAEQVEADLRSTLGEVSISAAEFGAGDGWIAVRLEERGDWARREPYVRIEGVVELAPGNGTSRSVRVHAVGTGHSADEARSRAERAARAEVVEAVRSALREVGTYAALR